MKRKKRNHEITISFSKQIANLAQLQRVLKNAVEEYNHVKPHASLHVYIPAEVYHGMVLQSDLFSELMQQHWTELSLLQEAIDQW